ncbi:MAG: gamma-glutamyltransferase family protein [Microbacteriaceae bacterium]|nr:gamma-glutamyltransferase family protein [Microbacteriaceae bacterium]
MMTVTTRPELNGDFGMVTSTHWLATATGMSVLERGGNAADAAVATGFVLQVVEPHLNGPGGEVPILLWNQSDGDAIVIAGQGVLPQGATIDYYRDQNLDLVPGSGLLAATVPGAFDAWLMLLLRWGTWSIRDVLEPAISLAERGWPVLPAISHTIAQVAGLFTEHWQHSAATWLGPSGSAPEPGSRMKNPELAHTWRRLLSEAESAGPSRDAQIEAARRTFYSGFVAEAIDRHSREEFWDSSRQANRGVLSGADLDRWRVPIEAPASVDYHGHTVYKTGPWGQGPVFLQQLALLSEINLPAAGHLSADYVHTVVEASKLAFADREAWYGDPDFVSVPLAHLLSEEYSAQRRALIGDVASRELRPGAPGGRVARLPRGSQTNRWSSASDATAGVVGVGEPTIARSGRPVPAAIPTNIGAVATDGPIAPDGTVHGDTCHLDVVDRHGMMISATPSGGWLPSSPTIRGLGFCLNSRAQMTWLEPGFASSLHPGSRPRTTLSPTLVGKNGEPYLAFGTPGGDQQDQWALQFFLSHVHFGLNLQEAIDAPKFHSMHLAESFWPRTGTTAGLVAEGRIAADVMAELERRGHRVTRTDDYSLGRVGAVGRIPGTRFLRAAADARGAQAYAAGR